MKIPKYINKLLNQRAKAAMDFLVADSKIVEWLDKNDIEVSSDHILTGACSLCEPSDSIEIIREYIREKETKGG